MFNEIQYAIMFKMPDGSECCLRNKNDHYRTYATTENAESAIKKLASGGFNRFRVAKIQIKEIK